MDTERKVPMSNLPYETDTALAELHRQAGKVDLRLQMLAGTAKSQAGADFYYRGRQRVTDMRLAEAEEILAERIASGEYRFGSWSVSQMVSTVEDLATSRAKIADLRKQMEPLNAIFAEHQWSRFFLVTSSAGHIHSSMSCSTCRPTTRYGWLPELSGKTEAEAVEAHGPALCSICFASAPVEFIGGKITKAVAAKAAA